MFIEDAIRPFWAPDIHNVIITDTPDLKDWLTRGNDYQINTPVTNNSFNLSVYDRMTFLSPISKDCNRFISSSIESIAKNEQENPLPKSIGWILVRQYYSAFYSAHLFLRLMGKSLTQLDNSAISKVQQVADLYGNRNGINIEKGYFLIDYSLSSKDLFCKKINVKADGGSHVVLWKLFGEELKKISSNILLRNNSVDMQKISSKLDDLLYNLSYVGSNNYSWLSRIRNDLNYKHLYGVWHPYGLAKSDSDYIKRNSNSWKNDILNIELKNLTGKEIIRFSNSCQFIIGLSNLICSDMQQRCSNGKSFLTKGYGRITSII